MVEQKRLGYVDCFPFYNEKEILFARFEYLAPVTTEFVLVECDRNHANKPVTPLFSEGGLGEEVARLFPDIRVRVVVVRDLPNGSSHWPRVYSHRNAILRGLDGSLSAVVKDGQFYNPRNAACEMPPSWVEGCSVEIPDGILCGVSDVDEFPNRDILNGLLHGVTGSEKSIEALSYKKTLAFRGQFYYYDLYTRSPDPYAWRGTRLALAGAIRHYSPEGIRRAEQCGGECSLAHEIRGGWHCSYFGGVAMVQTKIQSIAEAMFLDKPEFTDPAKIQARIASGADLYDRAGLEWERLDRIQTDIPDALAKRFPNRAVGGVQIGRSLPSYETFDVPVLLEEVR